MRARNRNVTGVKAERGEEDGSRIVGGDMQDVLELIDEALAERGWSARQASIAALGTPNVITNMRRGRAPSIDRLRAVCDVLGLECYIGRPRAVPGGVLDVERLHRAATIIAAGFPDAEQRLDLRDRMRLLAALYALVGSSNPDFHVGQIQEVVALARRFGVSEALAGVE